MEKQTELSQNGETLGITSYMVLERWENINMDLRADINAFGCILYEMLTGNFAVNPEFRKLMVAHQSGEAQKSDETLNHDIKKITITMCSIGAKKSF